MLMTKINPSDKKLVTGVSVGIALALILTGIINLQILKAHLIFELDQLIFLALIIGIFPPAVVNFIDSRWKQNVDKHIPEFLRELSEAGRTGVTLTRALELATKRRYGPLSSELERIVIKLSWGGNLEESFREFGERVGTKLAKRTATIISEVHRSGGDVKDVLDMVSKHLGELQAIDDERASQLKMYVFIIYIAFFIFLIIDFLLVKTLFVKMTAIKESMTESGSGGFFIAGALDLKSITQIMFHMSAIESLFGGLVAGKMGEGSISAGLKHSLTLMIITFLAFYILIWR